MTKPRIEPVDREAVSAFFRNPDCPLSVKMTLGYKSDVLLEAFAQHRIDAMSKPSAEAMERAREIMLNVEWQMDNFRPAEGETSRQCHDRRLRVAIAAALDQNKED